MPAGRGRPTKYKPEYARQAKKLCELGATDIELADFFEVNESTIYEWQHRFPDFSKALKLAKEPADQRVERSLYRRATGYSYDTVKIFQYNGTEVVVPYREHVPPDATSMIFWLKNRKRAEWRDRIENQHTGPDGGPVQVQRVDLAKISDDQLLRLAQILESGGDTVIDGDQEGN